MLRGVKLKCMLGGWRNNPFKGKEIFMEKMSLGFFGVFTSGAFFVTKTITSFSERHELLLFSFI